MAREQSDIARKAKLYLEKHQVEEIVCDMVNSVTYHQLKNPIIYMIKYLARMHCTEKELEEAGIKIDLQEQIEQPIICSPYPDLSKHLGSIKKHLNKDVFNQCKNKITPFGNNFRTINKIIQENPRSKIGLFAVDPGCYETYDQLFEMVLKDKSDTQPPEKYLHYKLPNSIFDDTKMFLEESVVIMRRNIHQQRFNATLQQRQQLTKDLADLLQQQQIIDYTYKFDLGQLEKDDMKKLQLSDKIYKRKDLPNREANTIENQFKGLRHPDWPKDRMLLMNQDKNNIVWINKEDHLKFKSISTDKSFFKQIDNYIKMNDFFLQKGLLSFDDKKYGYTTVKPQFSGLGMGFYLKYKFTDQNQFLKVKPIKEKLDKLPKNPFLIQQKDNKYLTIKFDKCAGYNLEQIIRLLCEVLVILFEGLVQVSKDHVVIEIEQKQEEQIEYISYHNKRLSQLNRTKDTHRLIDICKLIQQDGIYFGNNYVKDKFIVIRRNLKFMNIRLDEIIKLTDSINQIDQQFISQAGLEIKQNQQGYILNKDQYQYGLLLNYDDDFTWIFPINKISISQQLNKVNKIIQEFEQNIKQEYAYDQHLGYLNNENKYIGSGASIIINFNIDHEQLKKLNEINKIQNLVTIKQTYLIFNNITDSNYSLFRELIIHFLLYLKKQQQQFNNIEIVEPSIIEQDCFIENKQLWAPTIECFNKFSLIFQNYVKNKAIALFIQLKKPPHRYIDNREIFCKLQDKLQITCTFYRNFQNYQYPHEMTFNQLSNFKKEVKEYLKENKYFDQSYQVKINKKHHLTVEFKTNDIEFIGKFIKTWSLLDLIEKKYPFQYDNTNLGYLGPVMNESLLEGFQLEIKTNQRDFNKYKEFGYSMEETGDQMYIYKSMRPCQIHIETEFLKGQ